MLTENNIAAEHPCGCLGLCKKCIVNINGKEELSCRCTVNSDITVTIPEIKNIVSVSGTTESGKLTDNICFAFDIGTTTLALALISLEEKKTIKVLNKNNPQRKFGADIMSRIDYVTKNGTSEPHKVIIHALNEMIEEVVNTYGINKDCKLYVSGNTAMLHLFFGIDCSAMGTAPYTPSFLTSQKTSGKRICINNISEVTSLPNVSAFVGADIVAGLNLIGFPQKGKYNLLIDLGTNAEIVLFSKENILCTSAAAGPCFEGVNISCGMSASQGAIYSYSCGNYSVIGNTEPQGICATGLVDIISFLIENRIIDETGYIEDEKFKISENVYLSGSDVRQFQLAKSAVYSAIISLISKAGISFDNIENMYVAGGFSSKLNIESAIKTGLLPDKLKNKFIPVNNSSLSGTIKYICDNSNIEKFAENATYIDLASDKMFSELFIENMMFKECY